MKNNPSQDKLYANNNCESKCPLVSIITPIKNGKKYLELCIQSVLNQSYSNVEHVFVDGCSTDGSLAIIKEYNSKYPNRVKYISEPDKGPADAWNKGFKLARGDVFGWLGADDMLEPGAVSIIVHFFIKNPDAKFVFGKCYYEHDGNGKIGLNIVRDFEVSKVINNMIDFHNIACPSAFYKRELVDDIGLISSKVLACDLEYWIRAGKKYKLYYINDVLSTFRIHEKSTGGSKDIDKKYIKDHYIISRMHGGRLFSINTYRYMMSIIFTYVKRILGDRYSYFINIILQLKGQFPSFCLLKYLVNEVF